MKRKTIITALILAALPACTAKFQLRPYKPGNTVHGVVYVLPRTKIRVALPYTLVFKETLKTATSKYQWKLDEKIGDIVVSTYPVPDPARYYEIDLPEPRSIFTDSTFSAGLSKEQFLTESTAHSKDQTLSVLAGTLQKIAEIVTPRGSQADATDAKNELDNLKATLKNVRNAYRVTIASAATEADKAKLDILAKRAGLLKDSIVVLKERIQEIKVRKVKTLEVTVNCEFDLTPLNEPKDVTVNGKTTRYIGKHEITPENCIALRDLVDQFKDSPKKIRTKKFWFGIVQNNRYKKETLQDKDATGSFYIYRIPYNGRFVLAKDGPKSQPIAEGNIILAQFGLLARMKVKLAKFDDKSLTIKLHPETGGIVSVEKKTVTTAGSNLAGAAVSLSEIAKNTTGKRTPEDKLKAATDRVKAQLEYLQKSAELEKVLRGETTEDE